MPAKNEFTRSMDFEVPAIPLFLAVGEILALSDGICATSDVRRYHGEIGKPMTFT
jgi:hypothetical protein